MRVLVIDQCVKHHHKFGNLKQCPFIISQFPRISITGAVQLTPLLQSLSQGCNQQVSQGQGLIRELS